MIYMKFDEAVDSSLAQAMAKDMNIIYFGEDVQALHQNLYVRFGKERVRCTPISESAFLGAAVTAAMGGLRPVVEIMMIDFIGVAMDALLNHAAKTEAFSGGKWHAPIVVRTSCGGGYGDGGQHEQCLWGWLGHIPGLAVAVPSNPEDAGRLMLASLLHDGPVIFMEHKLLTESWLDFLGYGGRKTIDFNVPEKGRYGAVPDNWEPLDFGKAISLREGKDLTIVTLGVSVHRSMEAAAILEEMGISATVIDIRTVVPLDIVLISKSVKATGRLLVVDEDYKNFGLSGELAAVLLERGIIFHFARVCTESVIPYSIKEECKVLPNVERIIEGAISLVKTE